MRSCARCNVRLPCTMKSSVGVRSQDKHLTTKPRNRYVKVQKTSLVPFEKKTMANTF